MVRDVTEERRRQLLGDQLEQVTGVGTWELDLTSGVFHASALTRRLHGVDHLEQIDARSGRRFYSPEVYGEVIDAYRRFDHRGHRLRPRGAVPRRRRHVTLGAHDRPGASCRYAL